MTGFYLRGKLVEHEIVRILASQTKQAKHDAKIKLDLLRDLDIIDEDRHSELYDQLMEVDKYTNR